MKRHTRLVQPAVAPGDPYHPSATPIYQTATFEQEDALHGGPFDYQRSGNPTRAALEAQLADLDGGCRAFAFTSGVAALSAVLRLVPAGGHVIAGDDLYGGTWRLLHRVGRDLGISVDLVDSTDPDVVDSTIRPNTRLILVESPSNPLQRIADIAALAQVATRHHIPLCVDATATSPWLCRPLELGADLVVHSATKLLSGHSDVSAGALVARDPDLAARIAFTQNAEGAGLAPFDSFLLMRGMRTLGIRLDRQQVNAGVVARHLVERVPWVGWPGLPDHPGAAVHARQASGPGVLVSFTAGSLERSAAIVNDLRRFSTCVSFGSLRSTVCLPCTMSHASIDPGARRLPPDLVRLSVGIEDAEDLVEDLGRALASRS